MNTTQAANLQSALTSEHPLISVIMPLYNKSEFLAESLASVINQNYPALEILIRDDGSSDNSLETANQLQSRYGSVPVKVFSGENKGASFTRNFLIERASSPLVMLMDADDIMLPGFLHEAVRVMRSEKARVVYSDVELFGVKTGEWIPPQFDPYLIRYDNCLTSLALIDRGLWQETGGYDDGLPFNEDWSFFIRAGTLTNKFYKIPKKLFRYRQTQSGLYHSFIQDNWKLNLAMVMLATPDLYIIDEVLEAVNVIKKIPSAWIDKFKKFTEMHPGNKFPFLALGITAEGRGEHAEAARLYSESLSRSGPSDWLPLYLLARQIEKSNLQEALHLMHRARTIRPDLGRIVNPVIKAAVSGKTPPAADSGSTALDFWRKTGYTQADVDSVCKGIDTLRMAARVTFSGSGQVAVAISRKTAQEGNEFFSTALEFFSEAAQMPPCAGKKGSVIVWLEKTLTHDDLLLARRAPLFFFGQTAADYQIFTVPLPEILSGRIAKDDPAYKEALKQVSSVCGELLPLQKN